MRSSHNTVILQSPPYFSRAPGRPKGRAAAAGVCACALLPIESSAQSATAVSSVSAGEVCSTRQTRGSMTIPDLYIKM